MLASSSWSRIYSTWVKNLNPSSSGFGRKFASQEFNYAELNLSVELLRIMDKPSEKNPSPNDHLTKAVLASIAPCCPRILPSLTQSFAPEFEPTLTPGQPDRCLKICWKDPSRPDDRCLVACWQEACCQRSQ